MSLRPEANEQSRKEFRGCRYFRRVERRHQIVGWVSEDIATEPLHERQEGPAVEIVGDVTRHAVLFFQSRKSVLHVFKSIGHAHANRLEHIEARRPRHVDVGDPRDAVNYTGLIAHRLDGAFENVREIPVRRRLGRVVYVWFKRREPAGSDPSRRVNGGDV